MSGTGIAFMLLICSVVWGGFLSLAVFMAVSERRKADRERGSDAG